MRRIAQRGLVLALAVSAAAGTATSVPNYGLYLPMLTSTNCGLSAGGNGQLCHETDEGRLWICLGATAGASCTGDGNGWEFIADDADLATSNRLAMKSGESLTALSLIAASSTDGDEMVVTGCRVSATLDSIDCDKNQYERCYNESTSNSAVTRLAWKAPEALTVTDLNARCAHPTADTDGTDDCSTTQVDVLECPATNTNASDVISNCTVRGSITGSPAANEWGTAGTLAIANGGTIAAGSWVAFRNSGTVSLFTTQRPRRKKGFYGTTRLCRICMSK